MTQQVWKKRQGMLAGLIGAMMLTLVGMWGCGTSGYDNPQNAVVTTKTASALIDASVLNDWMKAGLVNKAGGYDRVVILDSGNANYDSVGHIPGAQSIPTGSSAFQDQARAEGPMNVTGAMVCTGSTIDTLIQNAGIDENTTIVLTSSGNNTINLTRAYATFRYWGFPKNRIKILQGGNEGWNAAGFALTGLAPNIKKTTYGVAQNGKTNVNTDIRVSLGEMIAYVKGVVAGNTDKVTILDTIRPANQISSTTDLIAPGAVKTPIAPATTPVGVPASYTPFDGAMKGSYRFPYANLVTPANTLYFKDADTIRKDISAALGFDGVKTIGDANRDATKTFIVLCRAGNAASVAYFALDGIAYYNSNVDVKWYDGSYGQWNLMATSDRTAVNGTNAGGKLAVGSIWDTSSLMDNLTWNVDRLSALTGAGTPTSIIVNYASRVYGVEPSFAEGNQIETADKAYRSPVTSTTGGGSTSGGGGC